MLQIIYKSQYYSIHNRSSASRVTDSKILHPSAASHGPDCDVHTNKPYTDHTFLSLESAPSGHWTGVKARLQSYCSNHSATTAGLQVLKGTTIYFNSGMHCSTCYRHSTTNPFNWVFVNFCFSLTRYLWAFVVTSTQNHQIIPI